MSKSAFIKFAIDQDVLLFGDYTLKSGRKSPYFYNAGRFNTGQAISELGRFYAQAIINSGVEYNLLFGPAYKGIPLVTAVAASLWKDYGIDKPFAFDRKEVKDHGEGGLFVGAPVQGRVLIVDDVISAGTAFKRSYEQIKEAGGEPVAFSVSFDRQEKGGGELSAVQEVEQTYGVKMISIVNLTEMLSVLQTMDSGADLEAIAKFQSEFGVE